MSIRNLDSLLEPRCVAVIGASARSGSVGATVWRNVRAGRFAGPVFAVNRKGGMLASELVHASVAELPETPDLALVCTPPETVPGIIADLAARGTRAAIVMTAGLDARQSQAMLDAARPSVLRVLGPNCIGLLTPHLGLNASFAHTDALPGDVAFVSQSGALITAVLDWAKSRHVGFSRMVSLGAGADVDFGDLLDYLASDARTRSILLYIESIEWPRKFMSAARAAARNKPVIVVKAGRSAHGIKAAASHTGALAGSDVVFDAAIRRAGMLRVDTLQDLFMAAATLSRFRGGTREALTIMTNGGGAGVMAADAAAQAGVALAPLGSALLERLDAVLPATWSHANPIDIIGDAPAVRYTDTLQALLADPEVGSVLFVHAPTAIVRSDDIARACAPVLRESAHRVLGCWLGDAAVAEARRVFEATGVADFGTPEEAVRAFAMLATYRRNQALLLEAPPASGNRTPDLAAARGAVDSALAAGRDMLDPFEVLAVLQAYGIPTVPTLAVAASPDAAAAGAAQLGFPVALKIRSPDISHKSDVEGVKLGLRSEAELRLAAAAMLARVAELRPQARIDGFMLQRMVQRPLAQELIAGASIDSVFGPVVLFGHGGTAVEVIADRAIGLPPLNRVLALELVQRTRVARLLGGYRDHPPARLDAVCDTLIALSQMLADLPELAELDINPLWADHEGVIAVDARMRASRDVRGGAASFAVTPYPSELVRQVVWHGETIVVRPVRPEDGPQHRAFTEQLQPEDLRLRFFSSRRELPRSELARLTQIDYAREMAFIAARTLPDGTAQTLGVARAVCDPDNVEAEFAVIVRSDLKGRGLGHILLQTLIDYLAQHGTQRIIGYALRENSAMSELARSHAFEIDVPGSDGSVLRLVRNLRSG